MKRFLSLAAVLGVMALCSPALYASNADDLNVLTNCAWVDPGDSPAVAPAYAEDLTVADASASSSGVLVPSLSTEDSGLIASIANEPTAYASAHGAPRAKNQTVQGVRHALGSERLPGYGSYLS